MSKSRKKTAAGKAVSRKPVSRKHVSPKPASGKLVSPKNASRKSSAPRARARVGSAEYVACLALFAANLRQWRLSRKRKLDDVAREFGVATSTWGHWETGVSLPTGENLCLLAEFTRISLQKLVCPNATRCPFCDDDKDGGAG